MQPKKTGCVSSQCDTNRLVSSLPEDLVSHRSLEHKLPSRATADPECTCQTKEGRSPLDHLKRDPNLGLAVKLRTQFNRMCGGDEQRLPREHLTGVARLTFVRLFKTAQSQPLQFWPFSSPVWVHPGRDRRACEGRTVVCGPVTGPAIAVKASLWSRPHVDASTFCRAVQYHVDVPF